MFPTIKNPTKIEEKRAGNTISVDFDGGYKQTRERHTRDLKSFTVSYSYLSKDEKDLLDTHYADVRGSSPFDWTHADTGDVYIVRYAEPFTVAADAKLPKLYNITLKLDEV